MSPVKGGMVPPEGVTPNFEHPDKTLWTLNIVTQSLALSIVSCVVLLRLYTRRFVTMQFGLDDWTCFFGWIFAVGYSAIALTMSRYGAGIHQWEVPMDQVVYYAKSVYATMVVYGPCAICIKSSILLFMSRVFAPHRRTVVAIYICIAIMVAYYLPVIFLKTFICRPIDVFWDPSHPGECFNQRALILADSVISVLSDLLILFLPLPLASTLHMEKKKKIRIAVVFSAGGLACITSIIRLVDIVQNGQSADQTYVFMRVNLWGIAEVNIGLIAACLPLFPALYKRFFHKQNSRTTGYAVYDSSNKTFEMSKQTHRRRQSGMDKLNPDNVSDENVLIKDAGNPIGVHSSIHAASLHSDDNMQYQRRRSLEDPGIVKTVEVRQTIREAGPWEQ